MSDILQLSEITKLFTKYLSESKCNDLYEVSSLCLHLHNHPQGVVLKVEGTFSTSYSVFWDIEITNQIINSWKPNELQERGAEGIALLLIYKLTKYTVIERSFAPTGFDYWIGEKESEDPFKEKARLEISGILKGSNQEFRNRIKQKINQTKKSDDLLLPAYVIVVEFSQPKSHIEKR
ncbi:hypothetical protein KKB18_07455 [bacterium]|nr:hypothetical protein [bacterium]